jgi:RHS repeat-associated protein
MRNVECLDTTPIFNVYPQGQVSGTTPYFYTRDHLGSIREMRSTGKKGAIVVRFDYGPYGRSTAVVSNTLPDFNFTGLYRHAASNVDLAVYRAYDPDLGRWLSRDPIGERSGVNLYRYVRNDPIHLSDSLGLIDFDLFAPGSPEYANTRLFYDDPQIYDIGAHGNPQRLYSAPEMHPYTPQDLYNAIKNDANFQKADTVKIWACKAGFGENSFAEQFAKVSGKTTIAGTGYLDFAEGPNSIGHFSLGGTWRTFRP